MLCFLQQFVSWSVQQSVLSVSCILYRVVSGALPVLITADLTDTLNTSLSLSLSLSLSPPPGQACARSCSSQTPVSPLLLLEHSELRFET